MPKPIKLFDLRMHDGSRQFLTLPESMPWNLLRDHVAELEGVKVTGYLTDQVAEVWTDFTFRGQKFTINNQFGEYWFFVKNPNCPDEILQQVAEHCAEKTGIE